MPEFAFSCGTDDFVYEGCKEMAQFMEKELDKKIVQEYWRGNHNFFFWNEANVKALRFFGFEVKENETI